MKQHILLVAGAVLCSGAIFAASPDEGTPALRLKALKAERLATRPQAAGPAAAAKTVSVDCAKNGSISAAMEKNTGPLIIELRGICRENVRIERNDLTLRGANPLTDGLRGVTADPQPVAALELYYANRTRLENISVSDSPGAGVGAWFSALDMLNCRIERNGGTGIHISAATAFTGTELVVSQNTSQGINSQRQATVTCTGCRLEGNNTWAATSRMDGVMTLLDSVVSGVQGIAALDAGSYVDVDCVSVVSSYPCSINVQKDAARAHGGGIANLWGVGPFTGIVRATGGEVGVYGGQQPFVAERANQISDYGRLTTGIAEDNGPKTTLGRTVLSRFANAILWDATELSGTLECSSGSDAWSDSPYPTAKVVTCQNVPKIP